MLYNNYLGMKLNPLLVGYVPDDGKEYKLDEVVNSFPKFTIYIFKQMGLPQPSEAQLMIAEYLGDSETADKMLLALRGLGKSLFAQLYVMWRLLRNNNEHILVISGSSKRSKNFTNFVLSMIKSIPLLKHMYPRSDQRRASDHFDINGSKPSDSPNLYAAGIGTGLAGFRATIIVSDDIEQPTNSRTIEARKTITHFFNEAINLLISDGKDREGEVIILGTYQSTESIYLGIETGGYKVMIIPSQYPAKKHRYGKRLAPYIQKRIDDDPSIEGQAVDARFPDKVLKNRKLKIGNSAFQLQYNLDPTDSDETKFPLKLRDLILTDIDVGDKATNPVKIVYSSINKTYSLKHNGFITDHFVAPGWVSEERSPFSYVVMSIDPSGRGSDETGYSIGGLLNGKIYVMDNGGLKGGYDEESFSTIDSLCKQYKVNTIVIESNFGDGAYMHMLQPRVSQKIEEVRSIKQKELRIIETLEPVMNQHRLIFDNGIFVRDADTKAQYSLSYQLTHLTRERDCLSHDDRIDSLEMLVSHMMEFLAVNEDDGYARHLQDEQDELYKMLEGMNQIGGSRKLGKPNYADGY